jgi:hypothetical protein
LEELQQNRKTQHQASSYYVQPLQPIKHLNLESHSADNRVPATTINTLQQ